MRSGQSGHYSILGGITSERSRWFTSASFPQSALSKLGREAVARYYASLLRGAHDCLAVGAFTDSRLEGYLFGGVFRGAVTGFIRDHIQGVLRASAPTEPRRNSSFR